MTDRLLVYYDDLRRLAESKCASREEAEDLVSETFLAAYAYIRRGGVIEYPKTYLANTLMHKRNSLLRKAYRRPPGRVAGYAGGCTGGYCRRKF